MPEISFGQVQPSALNSGYGSVKSFLNNGLQVASEPINPIIILDLISLTSEIIYTFDADVIIQSIGLGASVNFTLQVTRQDNALMTNLVTNSSIPGVTIPIVSNEKLKVSAASSVNVRLTLVKGYVEVKL